MTKAYVITKGKFGEICLKKALPQKIVDNTVFTSGPDTYSAQTLAHSILADRRRPVVLVMDANTTHEANISEKNDFLQWFIGSVAGGVPYKIMLVIPQIEIIFFQDRDLLEQLIQRKVSDVEWAVAQFQPRKSLQQLLAQGGNGLTAEKLLDMLTDEMIEVLQKHYPVNELTEFLSSVIEEEAPQMAFA